MRYLLAIFCYNERGKIHSVLQKFRDYSLYDVVIMDDGSTDGFEEDLTKIPDLRYKIIRNPYNAGAGHSVRQVIKYAVKNGYGTLFLVAGNNKDSPEDIYKLVSKISEGYDLVQGSRYLAGGHYGNLPLYRLISTKFFHPLLFSVITRRKITDSTNGFRAIRLSIFGDPRIDIDQEWLDKYELEPYIFYKAITLGYQVTEVPVTKIYPPKELGYSKMKPITGWWSILRPIFLLGSGIKK